jgi:UDP-hydrolysing UDP-N-acetyl-D-glucosamine 2-epimerase
MNRTRRHITFVSGTRADLNLLLDTLWAIRSHPRLRLSVVATGMHLSTLSAHGGRLSAFRAAGFAPDRIVPWPKHRDLLHLAEVTQNAGAALARTYRKLGTDAVLVLGDRVEAFAAASAAHLARLPVAHIHGGDRAEGQLDDSLRHAITQLSHLHLAACSDSAQRLLRLGQDPATVHIVGSPGVERITRLATSKAQIATDFPAISRSALVLLHPVTPDDAAESRSATRLLKALAESGITHAILLPPNNDPGCSGILRVWQQSRRVVPNTRLLTDLPRPVFLGLLRDCLLLAGNSSAGIIEAGSFGTPVLDVGSRQAGRMAPGCVLHSPDSSGSLRVSIRRLLAKGRTQGSDNPYYRPGTSRRIANLLASTGLVCPPPPKRLTH